MTTGASFDLVVRGAQVADGSGGPLRRADVAVRGDRIVAVGAVAGRGGVEIDGTGKVLAPGFVDVHTHDDWAVLSAPEHACKVLQGCTTVVVGNCGTSIAPGGDEMIGRGAGFATVAAYLAALDRDPASVNTAALVGHGSVRTAVIGLRDDRPATDAELAAMCAHVEQAMADGALGLSTGLIYEPGKYAPEDELVVLAGVAAAAGGLLGCCGVNQINKGFRLGNLGYWIRSSATRRGYATEAARQVAAWAFQNTNLQPVELLVAVGNAPSQAVALKTGALLEGCLRSRFLVHGQFQDAFVYSLIRP